MATIQVRDDSVSLDAPLLIEGLPGIGLVGKIATDHVVDEFDMTYYASIDCDGLPRIAVYQEDDRTLRPPVRLYADDDRDLLALQSDIPISRTASTEFAECLTSWLHENDGTPLYLSGLPHENDGPAEVPAVYGVATGDAGPLLDEHDIDVPSENGVVAGPTGALLNRADATGLGSLGLVVESDPQFPDPAAARRLITEAINPIAGIEVDTDALVDRAEDIREQKEKLARRMQEAAEEESSQAQPLRMYQ